MSKILRILNIIVAAVLCVPSLVLASHAYLYLEKMYDFSRFRLAMLQAFGSVGAILFAGMALWVAILAVRRPTRKYAEDPAPDGAVTERGYEGSTPSILSDVAPAVPWLAEPDDGIPEIDLAEVEDVRIPFDPAYECEIPQPPGWYACTRGFHATGPCNPRPMPAEEFGEDVKTAVQNPVPHRRPTLSFLKPLEDPRKAGR